MSQMGPIPHVPEDGKVVALRGIREPSEVASGASMLIDVERGPRGRLYGVSQGQWDGVGEGSRAVPNTGRLVVVGRDGDLTPVLDVHGHELVLDRPTSVEFVGTTAYVVSVTGDGVPSRWSLTTGRSAAAPPSPPTGLTVTGFGDLSHSR